MDNILFRTLRNDESVENGITAKNPSAKTRLSVFLRSGSRMETEWVATTKSLNGVAIPYAKNNGNQRIAVIDMERLPEEVVIADVSERETSPKLIAEWPGERLPESNKYIKQAADYGASSMEVDLVGFIPKSAYFVMTMDEYNAYMSVCMSNPNAIPKGGIIGFLLKSHQFGE